MKLIKENIPFTMVANEVFTNKNLSFKAKGLYAYLFSKPDTWDFSSNRMILESKEDRKTIMAMLRELEAQGLLQRNRLSNGKMEYLLKYTVESLSPKVGLGVEKPKSENAPEAKCPRGEIGPISNKDIYSNKEEKVTPLAESSSAPFVFKDYLKELEDNKSRHINVIGLFFEEKGLKFDTRDKANAALKRHFRSASEVAKFSDKEILRAVDVAKKEYPNLWTVDTLLKILTR